MRSNRKDVTARGAAKPAGRAGTDADAGANGPGSAPWNMPFRHGPAAKDVGEIS